MTEASQDGSTPAQSACCDAKDHVSELCNDSVASVTCSDTFGESSEDALAEQYLICPRSDEVCGVDSTFELATPGLLESFVSQDIISIGMKHIPPGYVCSYTISLDQTTSPISSDGDAWMTQALIKRPLSRPTIESDSLQANIVYFSRD